MFPLRRPHPLVFLFVFALLGLGVYTAVTYLGGVGMASYFLIVGVVASAFWYDRPVSYALIGLYSLVALPPLLHLHLQPTFFWTDYVGVIALQAGLVEGISWQVRRAAHHLARKDAAEARLQYLIRESPMVTYVLRMTADSPPRLVFHWITENIADLTGYSAAEILAAPTLWHDRTHPDDCHTLWAPAQLHQADRPPRVEYRFLNRAGREIWIEDHSRTIRNSQGEWVEIIGKLHDITERKVAQQHVADARRFVDELVQTVPSEITVRELETGKVLFANQPVPWSSCTLDGAALPQEPGAPAVIHPDDQARVSQSLLAAHTLKEGDTLTTEYRVSRGQGSWQDVQVRQRVFKRAANGQPAQILCVCDDLTAIRAAERERAANEKVFRQIAEALPHMVYVVDATQPGTQPTYINRSILEYLGYSSDALSESGHEGFFNQIVHPDDRPQMAAILIQLHTDVAADDVTFRLKDVMGVWHWMRGRTLTLAQDINGQVTKRLGLVEDITDSETLHAALRHGRDFAQLVLGSLEQGVAVFTPDGTCTYANPAACRILGAGDASELPPRMNALLPGPDRGAGDRTLPALWMTSTQGVQGSYERSDGQRVDVQVTAIPRWQNGELESVIAVLTDITQQISAQQALQAANRDLDEALAQSYALALQAQAATDAKSDFLASMSHEIRTPMNAIVGMAELLQGTPLDHEQRDSVQIIYDSGQALLTIINDILDFSKIEAGRVDLDPHPFTLAAIVEGAVDLLAVRAREKGLRLSSYIDPAIPAILVGDSGRLRQILLNLLSNAVKFTANGRVAVRVMRDSLTDATVTLRLTVQDTGIGIAPEAIARLFQPFEQAERSTTRRYGGTGLGLAIVRRLAELMGGEIQIESQPQVGTTMILSLPFMIAPDGPDLGLGATAQSGRILICESDPVTREILERYTQAAGYSTVTCADPPAIWTHLHQDPTIAGVMMDLNAEAANARTRVTPWRLDSDLSRLARIEVLDIGQKPLEADAAVVRPIKRAQLTEALREALDAHQISATSSSVVEVTVAAMPAPRSTKHVLLAEDSAINQKVARLQLEKAGCAVDIVADGQAALDAYTADPERYALILMDCQMPVLDGFQATRAIRAWEFQQARGQHIHVVALTANALAGDREDCLAAGMDDYLSKPVGRKALEQILATVD